MPKLLGLRERILTGIVLALSFLRVNSSNALSGEPHTSPPSASSTTLSIGPNAATKTATEPDASEVKSLMYKSVTPDVCVCSSSCGGCGGCDSCSSSCHYSCTCG